MYLWRSMSPFFWSPSKDCESLEKRRRWHRCWWPFQPCQDPATQWPGHDGHAWITLCTELRQGSPGTEKMWLSATDFLRTIWETIFVVSWCFLNVLDWTLNWFSLTDPSRQAEGAALRVNNGKTNQKTGTRHYALAKIMNNFGMDPNKGSSVAARCGYKIPMPQLTQPISCHWHRPLALQEAFATPELFSSSFHLAGHHGSVLTKTAYEVTDQIHVRQSQMLPSNHPWSGEAAGACRQSKLRHRWLRLSSARRPLTRTLRNQRWQKFHSAQIHLLLYLLVICWHDPSPSFWNR